MVGLLLFLRRTLLGKAMVAVAFNKQAAALMGINVRHLTILAYALSAALAGWAASWSRRLSTRARNGRW